MRKLKVKCSKVPLLTVVRSTQWKRRMAYILVANKSFRYPSGLRSRIIYIGTTGEGARRPATSAVDKATQAFSELRGVKTIEVHIATCRGRKGAKKVWQHLETGLLRTFRKLHFDIPKYNKQKGSPKFVEDKIFRQDALEKLILQFAD